VNFFVQKSIIFLKKKVRIEVKTFLNNGLFHPENRCEKREDFLRTHFFGHNLDEITDFWVKIAIP